MLHRDRVHARRNCDERRPTVTNVTDNVTVDKDPVINPRRSELDPRDDERSRRPLGGAVRYRGIHYTRTAGDRTSERWRSAKRPRTGRDNKGAPLMKALAQFLFNQPPGGFPRRSQRPRL